MELQSAVARSNANSDGTDEDLRESTGDNTTGGRQRNRKKIVPLRDSLSGRSGIASWDPTVPGERVEWYSEYIARHAPLTLDWLQQPDGKFNGYREKIEVRGMGLLDERTLLGPLDDGGVCFWNMDKDSAFSGKIKARSRPGLLPFDNGGLGREWQRSWPSLKKIRMPSTGVVEGVSVDKGRNKAYFAMQSILNEVDLTTLQLTSHDLYPEPIAVLSEATDPTPLTVGTTQAIHMHDPRIGQNSKIPTTNIKDQVRQHGGFSGIHANNPDYAILSQPLPLSILHKEPDMIYVAGRFPSILTYDRRFFPQVASTIHSGARLSCITSIPSAAGFTLAAAGEYNGKGSLELYPLSSPSHRVRGEPARNRTSASRSKCLSLAAHGNRLLFSDSDGILKWVERDGSTLVRRWNINTRSSGEAVEPGVPLDGIFNAEVNEGDVARKLLTVTGHPQSDVCIWTGERVGILSSGRKAKGMDKNGKEAEDGEGSGSEAISDEERDYGKMMRRALERQADEVRFVRGLGTRGSF